MDDGGNLGDIDGPVDLNKYNLRVRLETASDGPITFLLWILMGMGRVFLKKLDGKIGLMVLLMIG